MEAGAGPGLDLSGKGPGTRLTGGRGMASACVSTRASDTTCAGTGRGQTSGCETPARSRPLAPSHTLSAPLSLGPEAGLRRQAEPGGQCGGASWDAGQAASGAVHPGIQGGSWSLSAWRPGWAGTGGPAGRHPPTTC